MMITESYMFYLLSNIPKTNIPPLKQVNVVKL